MGMREGREQTLPALACVNTPYLRPTELLHNSTRTLTVARLIPG